MTKKICGYKDCENTSETHEGEVYYYLDNEWICSECEDKINPEATGYCGVACKLGYGCDQSC